MRTLTGICIALVVSCTASRQEFYMCSFGQILDNNSIKIEKGFSDSLYVTNSIEAIVKSTFKNIYYTYFGLDTAKVYIEHSSRCRFAAADIDLSNGRFKKKLLYNEDKLEEIHRAYGNTWAIRAIIAHEVSHIVNVDKLYSDKAVLNEIWADYFAGIHLRRMNATEEEATYPFRVLDYTVSVGYPTREERVQLVSLGWKNGLLNSNCDQSLLNSVSRLNPDRENLIQAPASVQERDSADWESFDVYTSDMKFYVTPQHQVVAIDTAGVFELGTVKDSNIKPFQRVIEQKAGNSTWFIDAQGKVYELSDHGIVVVGEM
jgi:hypothetical protein